MIKIIAIISLMCLCIILSACSTNHDIVHKNKKVTTDHKLNIYTTVFAFQSFTKQIGGKYVNVDTIYPPGADMHTYEPSQRDMINIAKSDLFVYSSDDLDPVAAKITKSMNNDDMKLAVADDLNKKSLLEDDDDDEHAHRHGATSYDPHVWLDPVLDQQFAKKIKDDLIQKDPSHRTYYEQNYQALVKDLKQIDQSLSKITIHSKRNKVIISHDSLGYLARRYHFEQEGVSGMNNKEPSQKDILALINQIKETHEPYILYEQNISSKITDVIRKETHTKPVSFNNLAVLSKSQSEDPTLSYQSIMKKNVQALNKELNK